MENNYASRVESPERSSDRTAAQASEVFRQEAFNLYQCPGNGGIVTNPADCRPVNGYRLPDVTLTG